MKINRILNQLYSKRPLRISKKEGFVRSFFTLIVYIVLFFPVLVLLAIIIAAVFG